MTPTSGSHAFRVRHRSHHSRSLRFHNLYRQYLATRLLDYRSNVGEALFREKEHMDLSSVPPFTDPAAELTPAFWHNVTNLFENSDSASKGTLRVERGDLESSLAQVIARLRKFAA